MPSRRTWKKMSGTPQFKSNNGSVLSPRPKNAKRRHLREKRTRIRLSSRVSQFTVKASSSQRTSSLCRNRLTWSSNQRHPNKATVIIVAMKIWPNNSNASTCLHQETRYCQTKSTSNPRLTNCNPKNKRHIMSTHSRKSSFSMNWNLKDCCPLMTKQETKLLEGRHAKAKIRLTLLKLRENARLHQCVVIK